MLYKIYSSSDQHDTTHVSDQCAMSHAMDADEGDKLHPNKTYIEH